VKDTRIRRLPTGIRWYPFITEYDTVWRPLDEIWQQQARRLTQLPDRYFWYKRRGSAEAQLLHTTSMPDVQVSVQLKDELCRLDQRSAQQYATPRLQVQAEIEARRRMQRDHVDDELPPFGVDEAE
jgi:hypothetical protein